MKKILFLLLITISSYGQVATGEEQEFDYGIKNNAAQTVVVPNYVTTSSLTGVYGKIEPINLPIQTKVLDSLAAKANKSLAGIVAALGYTPANDTSVLHTTGNEFKDGFLNLRDQVEFGEPLTTPQEIWKMPGNSLLKFNKSNTSQYGFDITTLDADNLFWINDEGDSRQAFFYGDGDASVDSDIFGISASEDSGATYIKNFSITQAGKGYVRSELTAGSFKKTGGLSTEKLLANGSVDSNLVKITITTSVSITTATTDSNGVGQDGRHIVISNGVNAINLTCNGGVTTSYGKVGTGAITFVQGSGRTLVQLSGTAILNGAVGSTATLWSDGTNDYLAITNY